MDDPTYEYASPRAAAARFVRLYGERPGTVRGIDYMALSMATCNSGHETHQDIALEKLDEFTELRDAMVRAFRPFTFAQCRAYIAHRLAGYTLGETAKLIEASKSTVRRYVGIVETAFRDQLVERGLLLGYGGRDLAYVTEEPRDRVETWHGEEDDAD